MTSAAKVGLSVLALLLVVITGATGYSYYLGLKQNINGIEIKGVKLLSPAEYLAFTKFDNRVFENIHLPTIKQRFEEHPYVKRADVEIKSDRTVVVTITEVDPLAILKDGEALFFVTQGKEVVQVIEGTDYMDFPFIINSSFNKEKPKQHFKKDVASAFRIIKSALLINKQLYNSVGSVNVRGGGDVLLSLNEFSTVVILGKDNFTEKLFTLNQLIKEKERFAEPIATASYIDIRYKNYIYFGAEKSTGI